MLADKARSKTADSKTEGNSTILTLSPGHNDDKYKVNQTKFCRTFWSTCKTNYWSKLNKSIYEFLYQFYKVLYHWEPANYVNSTVNRTSWNFISKLISLQSYNIIYFNLTSQYYIVFKSVVWKKGDESFQKCHPGFGCSRVCYRVRHCVVDIIYPHLLSYCLI